MPPQTNPSSRERRVTILDRYFEKSAAAFSSPPKRPIFHLDFETYSAADLPKTGASVYSRHASTEVLMLAYGWSSGEVEQYVPAPEARTGQEFLEDAPAMLREVLADPSVTLAAWNAPFEMSIFANTIGATIPTERWLDVMALAFSLSLPGKLSKCGDVVGLPEDVKKMARGTALLRRFCKPRKPTKNKPFERETAETSPEEWDEFLEYNRRDVEAERQIYKRIKRYQISDSEWALWHLDRKINGAGIPINIRAVRAARKLARETIASDLSKMEKLTGLANPNSNAQILPWIRQHGYHYTDLKKGHVSRALDAAKDALKDGTADILGIDPILPEVLALRLRVSKASVKKYPALVMATDADQVLRDCHQFAGAARTARWAGRRFQPQNLPRPEKYLEDRIAECVWDVENLSVSEIWEKWDNPMDVLTASVRPMVQAGPGKLLVDADLSAIENVVLGWLARDDKILRVFRQNLDPYIDFAVDMFRQPYEELWSEYKGGDKSKRTTAKPGVLGCGYMLSAGEAKENPQTGEIEGTGLLGYAWNMGVDLTPEMAKLSVDTFRAKFEDVVQFWWDLDKAVRRVISTKMPETVGYLRIDINGPFLRIRLPSGRFLYYLRPLLQERTMPWKDKAGNRVKRVQITYENMEKGRWVRVTTHPGKLAENVTQAVARDILAHGMTLADRAGLDIRMHVHDQIVGLAPETLAPDMLGVLIDCMTTLPEWADDKLPLKAAGLTTPIFLKD